MVGLPDIFDKYERNARLWPALIVISPVLLAVAATLPTTGQGMAQYAVAAALVVAGLYALMQVVRHLGRAIEKSLWASWGGPPSTRFVLWSDSTFSSDWKEIVHSVVSSSLSIRFLSPDGEQENPSHAAKLIGDAFAQVKSVLKMEKPDGEYQTHNAEYGFARNLLGGCIPGAVLAGLSALWCAWFAWSEKDAWSLAGAVASASLVLAFLGARLLWLPSLARIAADRYAEKAWTTFVELKRNSVKGKRK